MIANITTGVVRKQAHRIGLIAVREVVRLACNGDGLPRVPVPCREREARGGGLALGRIGRFRVERHTTGWLAAQTHHEARRCSVLVRIPGDCTHKETGSVVVRVHQSNIRWIEASIIRVLRGVVFG